MLAIFRIIKVFKDFILYSKFLAIAKKESQDSPMWAKLRLRIDLLGRIYTVVNLPPEVTMSRDFPADAKPAYVFEEMKPTNDYLTKLRLHELLVPTMSPIKNTGGNSYLFVYHFFFRNFTWLWLIRFFAELFLIYFIYTKWDVILNFISNTF